MYQHTPEVAAENREKFREYSRLSYFFVFRVPRFLFGFLQLLQKSLMYQKSASVTTLKMAEP